MILLVVVFVGVAATLLALQVTSSRPATSARSSTLASVVWSHVRLPALCGSESPITPKEGRGDSGIRDRMVNSHGWRGYKTLEITEGTPSLGDLFGTPDDGAVVPVTCSTDSGTADGQILFAQVVYRLVNRHPLPVAILTPRVAGKYQAHVPIEELQEISPGRVVNKESFYGPHDSTCCATGHATTTWLLRNNQIFSTSTIDQLPFANSSASKRHLRVRRSLVLVRSTPAADLLFEMPALLAQIHLSKDRWLVAGLVCPPGQNLPAPCSADLVLGGAVWSGRAWKVDSRILYRTSSVGYSSDCSYTATRRVVPSTSVLVLYCLDGGSDGESFVAVFGLPQGSRKPAVLLSADCGTTTYDLRGSDLVLRSWPLHSGANDIVPQQPAFVYRWQHGSLRGWSLETGRPVQSTHSNRPGFCTSPGDFFGDV